MSNAGTKHINDLIRNAGARKQAAPKYDPGAVASRRLDLTERLAQVDESGLGDIEAALSKVERRARSGGVSEQLRQIMARKRKGGN